MDQALKRAGALQRRGRLIEAEAVCRQVVKAQPGNVEALDLLGVVASKRGDHGLAVDTIRRAIALDPRKAEHHGHLGDALLAAGRLDEAQAAYRKALALAPAAAMSHCRLGVALRQLRRHDEAAAALREALRLDADCAAAHHELGETLKEQGALIEAEAAYRRAVAIEPGNLDHIESLATLLYGRRRLDDVAAVYREAIERSPEDAQLHMRLGVTLAHLGRVGEAEAALRRALGRDPTLAQAHGSLGLLLLSRGALAEGWREYEWRWRLAAEPPSMRFASSTRWRGAPIDHGGLLLGAEQGLGEEILYASVFPDLLRRAPSCILECNARLVPLMARSFPTMTVVARRDPPDPRTKQPDIVAHTPTGSALRWFRGTLEDFPRQPSYLIADPARVAALRERYRRRGPGPLVGLSWRSANPEWRDFKSTALADWRPVLTSPGAVFVNLQYGDCATELAEIRDRFGVEVFHDTEIDPLGDLDGFAAQVAALDLVISVSNTTVHVAGALGQPCWALIPTGPGHIWYWFHGREDSPWYPSLRLLRQPRPGDWAPLIERAARDLAAWDDRRRRAN